MLPDLKYRRKPKDGLTYEIHLAGYSLWNISQKDLHDY